MNELVQYINESYLGRLRHKITSDTLKRWYFRGYIDDLTEAGIDAAFAAHKIPPKRGRPKKQDVPECPKQVEADMENIDENLGD